MQVTLKEIQDYWTNFCKRHSLDSVILVEGKRAIARNQDYWADHTMGELKEVVLRKLNRH